MRVFVTGASGHIGGAVTTELLEAGHDVVGLARSRESAAKLEAAGAEVRRGDLDDLDGLKEAAAAADGVIHLAFKHELMATGEMEAAIGADMAATQAFGDALAGTDKPFVNTSGTLMLAMMGLDRTGTEDDRSPGGHRADVENATLALADRGVRSSVIRLSPLVHSHLDKHGFGPILIGLAREKGFAGYPGEGTNESMWDKVHDDFVQARFVNGNDAVFQRFDEADIILAIGLQQKAIEVARDAVLPGFNPLGFKQPAERVLLGQLLDGLQLAIFHHRAGRHVAAQQDRGHGAGGQVLRSAPGGPRF